MGIRFDETTKRYTVMVARRHPKTGESQNLKRTTKGNNQPITTMAEAVQIQKVLLNELQRRQIDDIVPQWPRVIKLWAECALERGLGQKTVENYLLCLEKHTMADWSRRRISEITTQDIRDLMAKRMVGLSEGHKKSMIKFIKAIFQHGVEIGAIQRNPTPVMKFRIGDKIKGVLTESQVRNFLEQAKQMESEWYEIWATAIYTGMRSGELYALKWDRVNLEGMKIKVDTSWNNSDGFKCTKSGDDRMVEIAKNLLPILQELKLKNSAHSEFVLPRIRAWDKGDQARELRMFLMGMGLPAIRFHDLRATWATILLSKGVPPIKVMFAGGWKDMKTMMIYMRKSGVDTQGIMDDMDLHNPSRQGAEVIKFSGRGPL
jgi:integrase